MGTDVPCEARSQSLSQCQWWEVGDAHELADSHVHIFGMLSVTEMSSGEEHSSFQWLCSYKRMSQSGFEQR